MSAWMRNALIIVVALVVLVAVGYYSHSTQSQATSAQDQADVRSTVTNFGNYLKSIPLTEPTEALRRDIQQNYGQFVTSALLQQWRTDPTHAPGRAVSSPWPDHIDVIEVTPQGAGYTVRGNLVMLSSASLSRGKNDGEIPIVAQLLKENGVWKIAVFQAASIAPSATTTPSSR